MNPAILNKTGLSPIIMLCNALLPDGRYMCSSSANVVREWGLWLLPLTLSPLEALCIFFFFIYFFFLLIFLFFPPSSVYLFLFLKLHIILLLQSPNTKSSGNRYTLIHIYIFKWFWFHTLNHYVSVPHSFTLFHSSHHNISLSLSLSVCLFPLYHWTVLYCVDPVYSLCSTKKQELR